MNSLFDRCAVYCISLQSAKTRFEELKQLAAAQSIPLQVINAVDGKAMSDSEFEECGYVLDFTKSSRALTRGEVGCLLSHRKTLNQFLMSGFEFALVLEDDAVFNKDLVSTLSLICELGGWEVMKLESREAVQEHLHAFPLGPYQIIAPQNPHLGSTAILYTKVGAQKTLKMIQRFSVAFDTQFKWSWQHDLKLFQVCPSLVKEVDRNQSTIGIRSARVPFHLKTTLLRRINRWICDVQKKQYAKKLRQEFQLKQLPIENARH